MKEIKTSQAVITIHKDGLVDVRFARKARITIQEQEEQYQAFIPFVGQSSGLFILDPSNIISYTKEARNYVAQDKIERITKAAAILAPNTLSKMFAKVFIMRTKTRFPMRSFKQRKDAIAWLKTI